MALYVVTISGSDGSFDMDYRGANEDAVRGMAADDWPDFTISSVEVA